MAGLGGNMVIPIIQLMQSFITLSDEMKLQNFKLSYTSQRPLGICLRIPV